MKKHSITITGFGSLKEAAQEIGKMRYDALGYFLHYLMTEMQDQQEKDREIGREKLADDTELLRSALSESSIQAFRQFHRYKWKMWDEIHDNDGGSVLTGYKHKEFEE